MRRVLEGQALNPSVHLGLVRKIAWQVLRRTGQKVEIDDLESARRLGLMDAIDKFEPQRGLAFSTYASQRILGSILESLRAADLLSRQDRKRHRWLVRSTEALRQELGRSPTASEIAIALNLDLQSYFRWRDRSARRFVTIDSLTLTNVQRSPFEVASQRDERRRLHAAIAKLRARDRLVIKLYYFAGWSFRQIGQYLGVTESRVCQIHKTITTQLRTILSKVAA